MIFVRRKIRPMSEIKISGKGTAYIPDSLRNEIHPNVLPFILNANTALIFNPNKTPEEILESIEIIKRDVKLRIEEGNK